ncbi:MAG: hypothetical protein RJA61_554 [Candidatus Parcubacteria bacterium]|jgi:adenylate kinase family enzyme
MESPVTILLEGIQGCGKGTQGKALAMRLGHRLIGSGDLCRERCGSDPQFDAVHGGTIRSGKPLSDDVVEPLVLDTVRHLDYGRPRILEGFPRNHPQFLMLNDLLSERDESGDVVVFHLVLPDGKAMERALKRNRPDDTPRAIWERFQFYHRESPAILDAFRAVGWTVYDINAEFEADDVTQKILSALDKYRLLRRLSTPSCVAMAGTSPRGDNGC